MATRLNLQEKVVDSFRTDDFKKAMEKGRVFDFLPEIRKHPLSEDLSILKTWTDHLRLVGAPFVVISSSEKALQLWKIKKIDEYGLPFDTAA